MKRILSTILVVVLVVSSSGGAVAVTDVPAGMVGVPDANISEDVPVDSSPPLQASELEGSVMTSDHAETLEVVVTTPDRASDYLEDGTELSGSKGLSLVLQDEVHSAGRTVAIDAGAVKDALGYTPERVYGTHEDGEEWSRDIEYQGGMLMFEVPHFSSNSVTFSSEVSVTGTYSDGSTVSYGMSSLDAADNFTVALTGELATETDTETLGPGNSLSVAGNAEPLGPSGETGTDPKITYRFDPQSETATADGQTSYTFEYVGVNWVAYGSGSATVANSGSSSTDVTISVSVDGTQVASKTEQFAASTSRVVSLPSADAPISDQVTVSLSSGNGQASFPTDITIKESGPTSFTLTHGSTSTSVTGYDGGTESVRADLSTGSPTLDVSKGDKYSWTLEGNYTERSKTVDPSVSVNGEVQASHSGVLSEGETVTYTANSSVLQSGTNTVNVSMGSVSADAPAESVKLNYSHKATDKQTVTVDSGKWAESYNVSKTFSSDRSAATLRIPFQSDVVTIQSLEMRTNGGTWSSVPTDDYTLNNTKLTVHLGAVSGGDTVEVRTAGQQVVSVNSSITVLEPTSPGDRLDTKVRVDEWNDDSSISVGRTEDSGRIHYTYSESWDNVDSHVEVTAGGTQQLYLPGASTLSDFRVRTVPVRVNARSGEVELSVRDASTTEPSLYVTPGETSNDDVEYTLLTAADGEGYILRSETNNVVRDSATANSPVTLVDDDSEELLVIEQDSTTASEDDGPSSVGIGPAQIDTDTPLNSVPVILLAGAVILVGLAFIYRRLGWSVRDAAGPIPVDPVFALAAGLIAFVVIDYVGGGALTSALATNIEQIGSGISQIVPLAGIIGVALTAYWVYQNFILGDSGGGGSGSSRVRAVVLRDDDGGKK